MHWASVAVGYTDTLKFISCTKFGAAQDKHHGESADRLHKTFKSKNRLLEKVTKQEVKDAFLARKECLQAAILAKALTMQRSALKYSSSILCILEIRSSFTCLSLRQGFLFPSLFSCITLNQHFSNIYSRILLYFIFRCCSV